MTMAEYDVLDGRLTRIRQSNLEAWVRLGLQPGRKETAKR